MDYSRIIYIDVFLDTLIIVNNKIYSKVFGQIKYQGNDINGKTEKDENLSYGIQYVLLL